MTETLAWIGWITVMAALGVAGVAQMIRWLHAEPPPVRSPRNEVNPALVAEVGTVAGVRTIPGSFRTGEVDGSIRRPDYEGDWGDPL
jgi:hypothetical protein